MEKTDEPSTSGVGSSSTNSGTSAATTVTSGTSATGAQVPNADAVPSSAAARRLGIERTGAESDADLVNPQHLQSLMDMGFARDQCVEALLFTTSLEQATDYLLSAPPPLARTPSAGVGVAATAAVNAAIVAAMDTDGNDDDAVMRAIALSLTADSERSDEGAAATTAGAIASTSTTAVAATSVGEKEQLEHVLQGEPLSKQILDQFVQQALMGCLSLLDSLPETVYRVCSLVVGMVQRNGEAYRDAMLASLAKEIGSCIAALQVGT